MLDYQRQCCLRGKNICDKHQLICWQFTNPYHRSWIRIDLLPWVDHKTWRDLHWEKKWGDHHLDLAAAKKTAASWIQISIDFQSSKFMKFPWNLMKFDDIISPRSPEIVGGSWISIWDGHDLVILRRASDHEISQTSFWRTAPLRFWTMAFALSGTGWSA